MEEENKRRQGSGGEEVGVGVRERRGPSLQPRSIRPVRLIALALDQAVQQGREERGMEEKREKKEI